MSAETVYVTGLGAVSCLGVGVEAFWMALCSGRCGLAELNFTAY